MAEIFTAAFWAEYGGIIAKETWATLLMLGVSTFIAYLIGLPMGVVMILTRPQGIRPNKAVNAILGWIINIGRSMPFIILMIAVFPLTKFLVGTKIGIRGAVVPLVISAAPFIARMVETSLSEVDAGVIEAAQSMGASTFQIVWKVYLPEAKPSLILGGSVSLIAIVGYTAMAGTMGAGGLGDLAIRYGHQRSVPSVMWATVILLIIMVQVIQTIFNHLSRRVDKRLDAGTKSDPIGSFSTLLFQWKSRAK